MKIYLVITDEYHETPDCYGVFSSRELAETVPLRRGDDKVIYEIELDRPYKFGPFDGAPERPSTKTLRFEQPDPNSGPFTL